MKILDKPNDKDWRLTTACKNCESELEIEKTDVKYKDFYSGMDAEMSMEYYVVCPVCGKYVFLTEKKLPRSVQFAAESGYTRK